MVNSLVACIFSDSQYINNVQKARKKPPKKQNNTKLECGPMPNVMAALPNIGGALCSTPQSLADAHYQSVMQ